jgi:GTP-dependent phosphoenolpyruvate carboxykinase
VLFTELRALVFGVRGNVAVRRLANTVTFCDGHGVFFAAASGQLRTAASTRQDQRRRGPFEMMM